MPVITPAIITIITLQITTLGAIVFLLIFLIKERSLESPSVKTYAVKRIKYKNYEAYTIKKQLITLNRILLIIFVHFG